MGLGTEDLEDDLDAFLYAAPSTTAAADDFGPNTATPVEEPMPQAVEPELFAQPNLDAEAAAPDATAVKTIRDLRATLEVKFQEVATAKGEAARARSALEGWQNAFRDECKGMEPEPGAVAEALLTLRGAERKAGEAARDAKKREAALLFRVQAKEQELLELRSQVADLKTARLPENKDIHTLLLDPAVHSEFLRLQHEAEEAKKQVKALQGELDAVTYTAESVNGRRLRARLITWQKENDELAAQVSEGTVHKLECELALLKDYLTDVKRADHELLEDAELLEMESLELHNLLYSAGGDRLKEEAADRKEREREEKELKEKEKEREREKERKERDSRKRDDRSRSRDRVGSRGDRGGDRDRDRDRDRKRSRA